MNGFEGIWVLYYIILIFVLATLVTMTHARKYSLGRTLLLKIIIVGIPLIPAIPVVFADELNIVSFWPLDDIPFAGIHLICIPLTAFAGTFLLCTGEVRTNFTSTLLLYVMTAVVCGMVPLSIAEMFDAISEADRYIAILVSEIVMSTVILLTAKKWVVRRLKDYDNIVSENIHSYLKTIAILACCVDACYFLWLYEFGKETPLVAAICILTSLVFVVMIYLTLINVTYISDTARRDTELDAAKRLQTFVLPDSESLDWLPGCDIGASIESAKEVAGDFYDAFRIGERKIAFLVADVCDKGIPAAMFMMHCRTIIRDRLLTLQDFGKAITFANERLCEENANCMFVTAFIGILDLDNGELEYINAGHIPPMLKSEGVKKLDEGHGPVLGILPYNYVPASVRMNSGDIVLAYTDGLTEARSSDSYYGEDRIPGILSGCGNAKAAVEALKRDVDNFSEGYSRADDTTLLAVQYLATESKSFMPGEATEAVQWMGNLTSFAVGQVIAELFSDTTFPVRLTVGTDGGLTVLTAESDGVLPNPVSGGGEAFREFFDSAEYRTVKGRNVIVARLSSD